MYVEIHSKDEANQKSPGKSMWVNSDLSEIRVETTAPTHLNSPPWHLVIETEMVHERSSGSRSMFGETHKSVVRKLEVHLTPEDLSKLVNLALEKQLLTLTAKPIGQHTV